MRDLNLELIERFERMLATQAEILQMLKPFMPESKYAEAKVEVDACTNDIQNTMFGIEIETDVEEQDIQSIQEVDNVILQELENTLPPIECIYKEFDEYEDDEDEIWGPI